MALHVNIDELVFDSTSPFVTLHGSGSAVVEMSERSARTRPPSMLRHTRTGCSRRSIGWPVASSSMVTSSVYVDSMMRCNTSPSERGGCSTGAVVVAAAAAVVVVAAGAAVAGALLPLDGAAAAPVPVMLMLVPADTPAAASASRRRARTNPLVESDRTCTAHCARLLRRLELKVRLVVVALLARRQALVGFEHLALHPVQHAEAAATLLLGLLVRRLRLAELGLQVGLALLELLDARLERLLGGHRLGLLRLGLGRGGLARRALLGHLAQRRLLRDLGLAQRQRVLLLGLRQLVGRLRLGHHRRARVVHGRLELGDLVVVRLLLGLERRHRRLLLVLERAHLVLGRLHLGVRRLGHRRRRLALLELLVLRLLLRLHLGDRRAHLVEQLLRRVELGAVVALRHVDHVLHAHLVVVREELEQRHVAVGVLVDRAQRLAHLHGRHRLVEELEELVRLVLVELVAVGALVVHGDEALREVPHLVALLRHIVLEAVQEPDRLRLVLRLGQLGELRVALAHRDRVRSMSRRRRRRCA
mmetsp:Transcript_56721/g.139459  ORF Transcript_56721/g.139459 Transcript_56721/m.139459 type:complete len:532 (+) Transcript_56721:650-2245(+)